MDCEECGFSYESLSPADVPDTLRGFGKRYRIPLTRGLKGEDLDALLRAHPLDDTWSALEYVCHVRDDLAANADALASVFEALSEAEWERTFVYHVEGERTLVWVAQHTVHEGEHHLLDVGRVLRVARGR